ncbi:DNA 3'-5' helicase [Sphingomonas antarctica]|uniref:double-strand break repair helicase AddA n=1 Tax=Sphingomonas antarctica TaxID=2040274 RepID=UPI0039E923B8
MSSTAKLRPALKGAQLGASAPAEHVWLSASAGTGKTTVLAARVLRLLMRDVRAEAILCLTFTKAGAAEMARRVRGDLARWVRLDEAILFNEIEALGEDAGPAQIAKARQLFARLLEARGGGLRVMTIHAFCQTLLSAFPIEAGLTPGFRPIEGREADTLAAIALSDMVNRSEREGGGFVRQLQALSRRLGEDGARSFLERGSKALPALEELGPGLQAKLRTAFDVPLDFDASHICTACHDDNFDRASLQQMIAMNRAWATKTGHAAADAIEAWLAQHPDARAGGLTELASVWTTQAGTLRKGGPKDPGYDDVLLRVSAWCAELCARQARVALADNVAEALEAARSYGRAYTDAKQARGRVDFDDMIRLTRKLLREPGIGDWIAYKTDQRTDHILVDEAQDTNFDQWAIVERLTEEFFASDWEKQRAASRTLFTVGDFKQAIFSFQGTNPQEFENARQRYHALATANQMHFAQLSLDESYRTAQPILDVVDATLTALGPEAIGLHAERLNRHVSGRRDADGGVLLMTPVSVADAGDEGDEGWLDDATRKLADQIARQVGEWLRDGYAPGGGEALEPRDVMVLVRKRADLAALLVARLQEYGVPVAGVDRLRLRSPLVIKDLMAAMRFGAQPEDDLNLANLLVSPLIGWLQDDLFAAAYDRKQASLWSAVRDRGDATANARLAALLNAADRVTPYAFLEELLSGEMQGRRKLIARMGEEVRAAIDELLGAVLAYEAEHVATLQGFIDWFDRGDGEIVRDSSEPGNAARVMTVHGAKGLEARLVILADACADPEKARDGELTVEIGGVRVVIPTPPTSDRALVPALADAHAAQKAAALEEHWRLLYVAMTRARDQLVVAGALTGRMTEPAPQSWYNAVLAGMEAAGAVETADGLAFGMQMRPGARSAKAVVVQVDRPNWLDRAAPEEAKPKRPLAPSSLGVDSVAQPPAGPGLAAAARRGTLLHGLFERLPSLAPDVRAASVRSWLSARGVPDAEQDALIDPVCAIIGDPRFVRLFSGEALVEAPIAGVVGGETIAGTVDRLVIGDVIEVVDYKTGRRVPATLDAIPGYHLSQMAAYRDVLRAVFPGRQVRASLLYTEGPVLHTLDDMLLDAHKPDFTAQQQSLFVAG